MLIKVSRSKRKSVGFCKIHNGCKNFNIFLIIFLKPFKFYPRMHYKFTSWRIESTKTIKLRIKNKNSFSRKNKIFKYLYRRNWQQQTWSRCEWEWQSLLYKYINCFLTLVCNKYSLLVWTMGFFILNGPFFRVKKPES